MICFFFNDTATTEIYTLSLHDALPIYLGRPKGWDTKYSLLPVSRTLSDILSPFNTRVFFSPDCVGKEAENRRSEEHTSELQSRQYLVCRLLLEKKNKYGYNINNIRLNL